MERHEFGQLLAALRKEHIDEEGKQWTQEKLAQVAELAPEIVGNIERGRRTHFKAEMLVKLAAALNLTNAERRELLLAANPVEEQHMARASDDVQTVFNDIVHRISQTPQPAYLLDVYCDILACNDIALKLLDLTPDQLQDRTYQPVAAANMMRFVFAPEFARSAAEIMGERWHAYTQYHMALFKQLTLRYRTQPYFANLIAELRQWPLFRRYWFQLSHETPEALLETEDIHVRASSQGDIAYFPTSLTIMTSKGNLFLYVYVPSDEATAAIFQEISQHTPRQAYCFGSWPEKIVPPARERCVGE